MIIQAFLSILLFCGWLSFGRYWSPITIINHHNDHNHLKTTFCSQGLSWGDATANPASHFLSWFDAKIGAVEGIARFLMIIIVLMTMTMITVRRQDYLKLNQESGGSTGRAQQPVGACSSVGARALPLASGGGIWQQIILVNKMTMMRVVMINHFREELVEAAVATVERTYRSS